MSNSQEISNLISDLTPRTIDLTLELIPKIEEIMDRWRKDSDQASGDGTETMPEKVQKLQAFFAWYCAEVDIWTANPSDACWAVPILTIDGWSVKSWINAFGAKHLFLVSPNKKVYASTWAWGPVRHKVDTLEKQLLKNFSTP